MPEKLKESEKSFLLNKYLSNGLSERETQKELDKRLGLMVVSPLTIVA